jgi:hypothetical protein
LKKRTKSLLEEINSIAPAKDKTQILESRGANALNGLINLLDMIDESFDSETAADLNKRILLSIKNRDSDRFIRGIKKLRESR